MIYNDVDGHHNSSMSFLKAFTAKVTVGVSWWSYNSHTMSSGLRNVLLRQFVGTKLVLQQHSRPPPNGGGGLGCGGIWYFALFLPQSYVQSFKMQILSIN